MPLHGDDGQGDMLDAFDDVIAGAADGQQIFAQPVEGLMMGGIDRCAEPVQLIEEIGAGQAAVIYMVLLIRAVPLVGSGSGDMLDDGAAEGDVDDLHPLTDAEDRPAAAHKGFQRLHLQNIQFCVYAAGAAVCLAEEGGRDVAAAGQQQMGGSCGHPGV